MISKDNPLDIRMSYICDSLTPPQALHLWNDLFSCIITHQPDPRPLRLLGRFDVFPPDEFFEQKCITLDLIDLPARESLCAILSHSPTHISYDYFEWDFRYLHGHGEPGYQIEGPPWRGNIGLTIRLTEAESTVARTKGWKGRPGIEDNMQWDRRLAGTFWRNLIEVTCIGGKAPIPKVSLAEVGREEYAWLYDENMNPLPRAAVQPRLDAERRAKMLSGLVSWWPVAALSGVVLLVLLSALLLLRLRKRRLAGRSPA